MKWEFFCLLCNETHAENDAFKHECPPHAVVPRGVPTRWDRFWALDLSGFLALLGGLLVSGIFTHHFHYGPLEGIFHGIGFGFVLGRLVQLAK